MLDSSRRTPSLRRHKPSGQGVVTLNGKDHYLGPWPPLLRKPPPDVQEAYDRLIAEWLASGRRLPCHDDDAPAVSISEVILAFWRWAEQHYPRADGTPTNEQRDYRLSLRPLRELYGRMPAVEFGPMKLKAVRQKMIEAGLSRGVVNQRVGRIVRMFKWAGAEEMVPEGTWRALTTVAGLEHGRTAARETAPVKPIADAAVDAVLPFALPPVAAMIQVQRLTGARPGEVCVMRACDIDTTGAVWLYRPDAHKTTHKGKDRVITLGPKAREIVRHFFKLDVAAYLFSPAEAMQAHQAARRAARQTPARPSQVNRRKALPLFRPSKPDIVSTRPIRCQPGRTIGSTSGEPAATSSSCQNTGSIPSSHCD